MKKLFTLILGLVAVGAVSAQEAETKVNPWKFNGSVGLNAAATGMWNWAAGGNNNVNGVAYTKLRLLYNENSLSWETNLDMEYGMTWIDQEYDALQKSSDKFNFNTKLGWEFHKSWYLTASAGFQSQFAYGRSYDGTAGFDPVISKWLAPSYTDIAVGIDWKPNDIFSIYLSPVAGRLTTAYVGNQLNEKSLTIEREDGTKVYPNGLAQDLKEKYAVWSYTVLDETTGEVGRDYKKNLRAELGLSLKGTINYTYKDLKIITSVGLFTPYQWDKADIWEDTDGKQYVDLGNGLQDFEGMKHIGYRDNNRRFGNFDVDWDLAISYQFLKCLQVSLNTSLKYYNGTLIEKFDKEGNSLGKAERVQFKSVIGLGIGYSF